MTHFLISAVQVMIVDMFPPGKSEEVSGALRGTYQSYFPEPANITWIIIAAIHYSILHSIGHIFKALLLHGSFPTSFNTAQFILIPEPWKYVKNNPQSIKYTRTKNGCQNRELCRPDAGYWQYPSRLACQSLHPGQVPETAQPLPELVGVELNILHPQGPIVPPINPGKWLWRLLKDRRNYRLTEVTIQSSWHYSNVKSTQNFCTTWTLGVKG